ncbi:protease complex subunit PrcB family protein [Thermoproteota archaeon]
MKRIKVITIISIIILTVSIGGVIYFGSANPSHLNPEFELNVHDLIASTDGQVSFNVTLQEGDSGIIEAVYLNNTRYSWSEGSQENSTISKGEDKHWSVTTTNLINGSTLQVVVEAPPEIKNTSVIVEPSGSPDNDSNDFDYIYDNSGGVGLFSEGIHVIATEQDPRKYTGDFHNLNDYWKMLQQYETTQASNQEFISVLLSRGDKPTGGYTINVESFGWLESYPVQFRFHINVTDPGEGLVVTQALTNPLMLMPITKLSPGEYHIQVSVTQFIQNVDEEGNISYQPIMTFAPVIWEQTLTITKTEDSTPSTTFEVILNGNEAPDLNIQVDLTNGLTEDEAKKIAEAAFVRTLEGKLHRLDSITYDNQQIVAHYTWGYDENDMGHIFDITAEITKLQITIVHCR